ncbi:exported hypothetical protein [Vibrio nigripulchritudo MADA3029]|uniref:hypothetical protein n=1 Tax=Vibrio nigripulchritudo TaxID=28173 RepID=UPI0003B1C3C2|nr:hypothetical protein [Vibrio nigripulchritudo]CCN49415.1 exported hypothetical protein [Vibrio nigripulchritudo MADA3020]CCN53787.1 exported hypothetical protein [Vibrio nigripulchritudo MADA3021]CCN58919.1 exported hypothetical protein [Vibrio nigripulchritudo MADA3029]
MLRKSLTLVLSALVSLSAVAEMRVSDNTRVVFVAVNGGSDSHNSGTSCIKVSNVVSSSCESGFIAIPNNNKALLSAALQAKATNVDVWVNYNNASVRQHCPGLVFTHCTVSSIALK